MEYCANNIIVWAEFEVVAGLGFLLSQFGFSTETPSFCLLIPPERAVEDKGNEGVKGERSWLVWRFLIAVNGLGCSGNRLQRQFPWRGIIARRTQGDGLDGVRLNGRETDGEGLIGWFSYSLFYFILIPSTKK